ncbi:hypothetical protein NPIL_391761 [Nephila pilipes]|uniref:Uncharacterized protein n=1 Tax=Nephila pilipes TaxID=299642 RepID=A0A8X6QS82_NEPPI|nr:hypothetical protein NPIL_391761 [Nephila pilipes]
MAIAFLSEIMMYLISCFVVDFMRGSMPSFGEIIVCVFLNEMIKILYKWYYGNGTQMQRMVIPEQINLSLEHENEKKGIPVVHSLMIFKMCEGLDIEVELAPIEERDTWDKKIKKKEILRIKKIKKSTQCIPIVRSETVFKICNALNLPADFELTEGLDIEVEEETKTSSRINAIPIVNSVVIYKTCLALGLPAQLNENA